jgi:pro-apoptotic serine protease NMA111
MTESDEQRWEKMLAEKTKAIVVLRVCAVRSFDTETVSYSVATGFVVDANLGLILTNRHVIGPGPCTGDAVFTNHEEVDVTPLYADPLHDFGFFRFDPDAVKFMSRPLCQLELAPDEARMGLQIRVAGNDAGEKLSILSGTLARLDRPAPKYGAGAYSDCNTFYYQAASSTSGGSSGSPVLSADGVAVALNCGGKKHAASSFYLPLHRVARALEHYRRALSALAPGARGEALAPPSRGTLQTVFKYRHFDELKRLGLDARTEAEMRERFPDTHGMLAVSQVVPSGPAYERLKPGDILLAVDGAPLVKFLPLEEALDARVGDALRLDVMRGGEPLHFEVRVANLHAITPCRYVEASGAVLNALSYHLARSYTVPCGSVYLASRGHSWAQAGIPKHSVIVELAHRPTPTLDEFARVFCSLPDGKLVAVKYRLLERPDDPQQALMHVERHWHPFASVRRNDATGLWEHDAAANAELAAGATAAGSVRLEPATARYELGDTPPAGFEEAAARVLRSLVMVEFQSPCSIDGVHSNSFLGTGVVFCERRGLVLADRNTAPNALGDVYVQFASSVTVPARVVYTSPVHNFAVLRYEPSLLGDTPVAAARFLFDDDDDGDDGDVDMVGRSALFAGLSRTSVTASINQNVVQKVKVTRRQELLIAPTSPPRFRQTNMDIIYIDVEPSSEGAVLADRRGRVFALWLSFSEQHYNGKNVQYSQGVDVAIVRHVVEAMRAANGCGGDALLYRSAELELAPLSIAEARQMSLPAEWLERVDEAAAATTATGDRRRRRRQLLSVTRTVAGTPAAELMRDGDIVLAEQSAPATPLSTFLQFERAVLASADDVLALTVFRAGKLIDVRLPITVLDGVGTSRVLFWCGGVLQSSHRAIAMQQRTHVAGVYCSRFYYGSPNHRYGLRAAVFLTHVNDTATPTLDAFIEAITPIADREAVRITTRTLNSARTQVLTLKTSYQYWPTRLLRRADTPSGWLSEPIVHTSSSVASSSD